MDVLKALPKALAEVLPGILLRTLPQALAEALPQALARAMEPRRAGRGVVASGALAANGAKVATATVKKPRRDRDRPRKAAAKSKCMVSDLSVPASALVKHTLPHAEDREADGAAAAGPESILWLDCFEKAYEAGEIAIEEEHGGDSEQPHRRLKISVFKPEVRGVPLAERAVSEDEAYLSAINGHTFGDFDGKEIALPSKAAVAEVVLDARPSNQRLLFRRLAQKYFTPGEPLRCMLSDTPVPRPGLVAREFPGAQGALWLDCFDRAWEEGLITLASTDAHEVRFNFIEGLLDRPLSDFAVNDNAKYREAIEGKMFKEFSGNSISLDKASA